MSTDKYILVGKQPVQEYDLLTWARWFETADRVVKQENIGPYSVSTVFLGLDHSFHAQGPPILFETMVFWRGAGSQEIDVQERCSTWEEAEAQHEEIAQRFRAALTG